LQQYGPWRVFPQLPPAGEFITLIDEAVRASA
jgi:hypothetical protein